MRAYRSTRTGGHTECLNEAQIEAAVADANTQAVIIYNSGQIITRMDGSQYAVWSDGSLRKIKDKD